MRILVTGGAGFIESHVVNACVRSGHEVCVLDDLSTGLRENIPSDVVFYRADIRDAPTVRVVFDTFRPEMISHQAAHMSVSHSVTNPQHDASVNNMGTLTLLQAAHERARKCGSYSPLRARFTERGPVLLLRSTARHLAVYTP